VVRLLCLIALVAALTAGLAARARADADPASDYLYARDVFVPFSGVSPAAAKALTEAAARAHASGNRLKVAVIASKRDLGGVPQLFGNPNYYARFLGAELTFLYSGKLLVVMPQGAALSERGKLLANPVVLHAHIGADPDGAVRSATGLYRELTGQAAAPTGSAASSGGGVPGWVWAIVAVACVALVAGAVLALLRLRRRPAAS
jgi:hypothetical protein